MAYRFFNPAPVFLDIPGLEPLAGGTVTFYEIGTGTLKDTWSDPELTIPNTNPIPLDAGGRLATDVFCDGSYTVRIQGTDGTNITRDIIPEAGASQTIPTPTAGWFLTSPDGVTLAWAPVLQLPDPTGQSGKILSTDGSNFIWISIPEPADPDIVLGENSFQAGLSTDPTKALFLRGTDTAPATNYVISEKEVTFSPPFKTGTIPFVKVSVNKANVAAGGYCCDTAELGVSATGFTAHFNSDHGTAPAGASNIVASFPFSWFAFGEREIEEETP